MNNFEVLSKLQIVFEYIYIQNSCNKISILPMGIRKNPWTLVILFGMTMSSCLSTEIMNVNDLTIRIIVLRPITIYKLHQFLFFLVWKQHKEFFRLVNSLAHSKQCSCFSERRRGEGRNGKNNKNLKLRNWTYAITFSRNKKRILHATSKPFSIAKQLFFDTRLDFFFSRARSFRHVVYVLWKFFAPHVFGDIFHIFFVYLLVCLFLNCVYNNTHIILSLN